MHFVTFGTRGVYNDFARRLARSATDVGGFATATVYDESHFDADFEASHRDVLALTRGFGAWCWKSYCILKRLNELAEGEILTYCDSLYAFKRDMRRNAEEWLKDRDVVLFENKPSKPSFLERNWSKYDAFRILGADPGVHGNQTQCWAGFVLLRKTPESVRFVRKWYDACADARLMNDEPSVFGDELPGFVAHREDQSVISLMSKVDNVGYPFLKFPADLLYNIRIGR
jgi:hypothetical protein